MSTARKTPVRRPGAKKPARPAYTNLDAVAAEAKAEGKYEPFPFTWQGREWTMLHQEQIDTWDVVTEDEDLTENERILMTFEIALGDQWEDFKATPLPLHLLQSLFEDYNAYCGSSPGEDGRSSGS
jgi:hypothetical protein